MPQKCKVASNVHSIWVVMVYFSSISWYITGILMYYIQFPSLHTVFLKCMGDHLYLIFLSDELCCGKPRVQILANPNHFVMSPYFTHPPTVHAWKKLVHEHQFASIRICTHICTSDFLYLFGVACKIQDLSICNA